MMSLFSSACLHLYHVTLWFPHSVWSTSYIITAMLYDANRHASAKRRTRHLSSQPPQLFVQCASVVPPLVSGLRSTLLVSLIGHLLIRSSSSSHGGSSSCRSRDDAALVIVRSDDRDTCCRLVLAWRNAVRRLGVMTNSLRVCICHSHGRATSRQYTRCLVDAPYG